MSGSEKRPTTRAKRFSHLVVVGASAGGIEALLAVVATLRADFPAPIVIAQHLEPTRQSHLEQILARRSTLPVRTVTDQEPLRPGTIFVVPANRNVLIGDHQIRVQQDGSGRPKPSVDMLLSSAARSFGEGLIAVILSGSGSDGAAGARAVKQAGGTVVIQDPGTASYPGMPLSLAPTTVDIVAELGQIGTILGGLVDGIEVARQPVERRTLAFLLADIRERFGMDFTGYKTPTILRRLQRRIVATGSEDFTGYLDYLSAHPQEYQQLINAFLIKVTEFFRDAEFFDHLRRQVLPNLIAHARQSGKQLRLWSAGCATGEEAYSLAILVADVLGGALDDFRVRIFATDLDAEAIDFARRGVYPAAALSEVPEELVGRYFTPVDSGYQIRKRVRALTVFGQHDLGQRAPFPNIDLVLCRNVLIYFTPELRQHTLHLFAYSLRNGGYLALGRAETANPLAEFFALQNKGHKVYRRHGERMAMPLAPSGSPLLPSRERLALVSRPPGQPVVPLGEAERAGDRGFSERFLLRLTVGVAVVDRRYDIQAINGAARRFFSIFRPAVGEDLLHIAQGVPVPQLRGAIDEAFREGVSTGIDEFTVEEVVTGQPRTLQVTCHPQRSDGGRGPVATVILIVNDITDQVQRRRSREQRVQTAPDNPQAAGDGAAIHAAERDRAVQRLMETNRQLLEANQELTAVNEEMRVANEEFMLGTEAAQAATEEVETLNEELQATNEELETLNEELQATVEELNTTNDDLHARSVELQEVAHVSEEARAWLEAILANMSDAVLVVDGAGTPVLTNAAYQRTFGVPGVTLLDEHGQPLPLEAAPRQRAARGESFGMELTLAAEDGARRWFEASGQPFRGADDRRRGGVVVVRDITERSLQRMQEEFVATISHDLRTPLTAARAGLGLVEASVADRLRPDEGQLVSNARRNVERLGLLIDDLVTFNQLQSGTLEAERAPLDLRAVVTGAVAAVESLIREKGQTLEVTLRRALPTVGDARRLEQVLVNLLGNAYEHTPPGTRIAVSGRVADGEVVVTVADNGPGIPPERLEEIFGRTRARNGASGLGLLISRRLTELNGGRLWVEGPPEGGIAFHVALPRRRRARGVERESVRA